MKNIRQIEMINKALSKEKEKFVYELSKINIYIARKIELLKKIIAYQKDYSEPNKFNITHSIPLLNKNLESFTNQIKQLINTEEKEINNLQQIRMDKLKELEKVEQKIKVMEQFERKINIEKMNQLENKEQRSIDEMAANKHTRNDYE
jgi:flagellar biosynthesis chaperone FliJ